MFSGECHRATANVSMSTIGVQNVTSFLTQLRLVIVWFVLSPVYVYVGMSENIVEAF